MRGGLKPALRMVRSVSTMASTMSRTDSRSATSRSGMCEVTRAFHMPSTTLNSLARPSYPRRALAHCSSSSASRPALRMACLLNGRKHIPSTTPPVARSSALPNHSSTAAPAATEILPNGACAGSTAGTSSRFGSLPVKSACSTVEMCRTGAAIPVTSQPARNTRASETMRRFARSRTSSRASSLDINSGPTPAASPCTRAMVGFIGHRRFGRMPGGASACSRASGAAAGHLGSAGEFGTDLWHRPFRRTESQGPPTVVSAAPGAAGLDRGHRQGRGAGHRHPRHGPHRDERRVGPSRFRVLSQAAGSVHSASILGRRYAPASSRNRWKIATPVRPTGQDKFVLGFP